MRKILFIDCCGECIYWHNNCGHSEAKNDTELLDKWQIPLWCPLENADKEGE